MCNCATAMPFEEGIAEESLEMLELSSTRMMGKCRDDTKLQYPGEYQTKCIAGEEGVCHVLEACMPIYSDRELFFNRAICSYV